MSAMLRMIVISVFATLLFDAPAAAGTLSRSAEAPGAHAVLLPRHDTLRRDPAGIVDVEPFFQKARRGVAPPTKLAIIACRVDRKSQEQTGAADDSVELEWRVPAECMRTIETVSDAAALNHLWLRQITPNLASHRTCAEVAMAYAPVWEVSHRSWAVVKVGCPTKIVDADGNVVGWHMPECQGVLPGTTYPLRCRFDPSEI